MLAPDALIIADVPLHKPILLDETDTSGIAFTVTETVFVDEHPLLLPVIVYVVDVVGEAITVDDVVLLSPVAGAQVYVLAPPALSDVENPLQIEVLLLEVIVGLAFTVMATVRVFVQPALEVPIMV